MIYSRIPVQVIEAQFRLHQRDAGKRNRSQICGSRAVDLVNGLVCIGSRSLHITDQVIVRRSFRVRGRCGIECPRITEGQLFIISVCNGSRRTGYRTCARAVPDCPLASDLFVSVGAASCRNLLLPSYIDPGDRYIVCVTVIGRILENNVRSNCLVCSVSSASGSSQSIEPQRPLELRRHGNAESARPVFSVHRVVQYHFNRPGVAAVVPPQSV